MSDLNYFIGRVCTIFTVPINRDFKSENPNTYPKPLHDYFTGIIENITEDGITMTKIFSQKNYKSFFFLKNVISISEEEIFDPEKDVDKLKDMVEMPKTESKPVNKSPYVDLKSLSELNLFSK